MYMGLGNIVGLEECMLDLLYHISRDMIAANLQLNIVLSSVKRPGSNTSMADIVKGNKGKEKPICCI